MHILDWDNPLLSTEPSGKINSKSLHYLPQVSKVAHTIQRNIGCTITNYTSSKLAS